MSQYDFYLKQCLLPIAPSQLKITINNNNSTYILIDEGQINILKKAKLTDIEFAKHTDRSAASPCSGYKI